MSIEADQIPILIVTDTVVGDPAISIISLPKDGEFDKYFERLGEFDLMTTPTIVKPVAPDAAQPIPLGGQNYRPTATGAAQEGDFHPVHIHPDSEPIQAYMARLEAQESAALLGDTVVSSKQILALRNLFKEYDINDAKWGAIQNGEVEYRFLDEEKYGSEAVRLSKEIIALSRQICGAK